MDGYGGLHKVFLGTVGNKSLRGEPIFLMIQDFY